MHHPGQRSLFLLREKKWHHTLSDLQNGWTLQTQKTQFVILHHRLWFSVMLQSVWKIVSLITQPPVECKIQRLSRTKISLACFTVALSQKPSISLALEMNLAYLLQIEGSSDGPLLLKLPHNDGKFPVASQFNNSRRWQSSHRAQIKHGLFAYVSRKGGNGSIIHTLRISKFGRWITPCLKGHMSCICKKLTAGSRRRDERTDSIRENGAIWQKCWSAHLQHDHVATTWTGTSISHR